MIVSKSSNKYDNVTVALHWVIGIGILSLAGIELFRQEFPKGHFIREGLKALHQPVGTALLVLIMFRLAWRMTMAKAPAVPSANGLLAIAAKIAHLALYALMIGLPLLGLLYVFGSNKVVDFGLFSLAMPLKDTLGGLAKTFRHWHESLGIAILVLGLVHAAAALMHHYVLKDGLLSRMRFGRSGGTNRRPPQEPIFAAE
jgi:superoxide oxidase